MKFGGQVGEAEGHERAEAANRQRGGGSGEEEEEEDGGHVGSWALRQTRTCV